MDQPCNENLSDKTDDLHTCVLPKGHDGPHRCSEDFCDKEWS